MAIETAHQADAVDADVGTRRVAKNTVIYFAAQIVSWLVTFTTVSVIPRKLGETAVGQLAVAGAAVTPITFGLMLGVESYLTYEVGRDRRQTESLLRATLGMRLAVVPLMVAGVLVMLWAVRASTPVMLIGFVMIVGSVVGYLSEPLRAVLAGWEEARRVSTLDLLNTCAPLLCIPFLLIASQASVGRYGALAYVLASLAMLTVVAAIRGLWVGAGARLRPAFDWPVWVRLVRGGAPFIMNDLVLQLYGFTSIFILRHYTNEGAVGEFSQAQRLFGTFLFIPTALSWAIMPALARLADTRPEEFRALQPRVLALLIVVGLPVAVLTIMLAAPFCRLLYGHRFAGVPAVLQLYALNIIPVYVVSVMYRFLVAQRKNLVWTFFLVATVALVAILTTVFVPMARDRWGNGSIGAVAATVIAEVCSMVSAFILLKSNPLTRETAWRIARALGACAVMAVVVWATRGVFVLVPAVLGVTVFCVLGWMLKLLGAEEQARLILAVRRRLGRQAA